MPAFRFNEFTDPDEAVDPSPLPIEVRLSNLAPERRFEIDLITLDLEHHNTYRTWQSLGSPSAPTGSEVTTLLAASELAPEATITVSTDPERAAALEFRLAPQSRQPWTIRPNQLRSARH